MWHSVLRGKLVQDRRQYIKMQIFVTTQAGNFHAVSRMRRVTSSLLEYAREFSSTLSAPNFRRHLSSVFFCVFFFVVFFFCFCFFFILFYFFFYLNKLSFGKTFICKVERLNVKQRRSRWDGSLSRLIWIYAVCKGLLLSHVAVKELTTKESLKRTTSWTTKYITHPFSYNVLSTSWNYVRTVRCTVS